MNLIADIGNSFTKIAFYDAGRILKLFTFSNFNTETKIPQLPTAYLSAVEKAIVSSVKKEIPESLLQTLSQVNQIVFLDEHTPLPIKNSYTSKSTLGKDRIAAAVGANNIFPYTNVLVIDAGTALTIDFVNQKNEFTGGVISPGLTMRYRALHEMTEKLPKLEIEPNFTKKMGKTTEEAIRAGVQNGICHEINAYTEIFSRKYKNLKAVITGGDIFFFENKLKKGIFAAPNLVLDGLNKILHFHYDQQN